MEPASHIAPPASPASSLPASLLGWCGTALDRAVDTLADASRVTKFLRGRLEFVPWDDDIFISSYPRSGTTWMQFLVYLLATDGSMDFQHISQVTPWWERALAWGNATADDFARRPGPRIFKSHLPYAWLPRRGRCIYMVRNGRDVAVSYYHLYCSHLGFQGSFSLFFQRFLRGELQYGSWFKHVAGWKRQRDNPRVLILAYEDLQRALPDCLGTLSAFLGLRPSDAKCADVLSRGSFAFMKAHEDKFDHIGELRLQRGLTEHAFLRRGKSGEGGKYLTAAQHARFEQALADPIRHPDIEWRLADFLH